MHFRRFAALLLGVWLAGCVFMDMVATQNFRSVDHLLAAPPPQIAERYKPWAGTIWRARFCATRRRN
jgi:hypothetical protein